MTGVLLISTYELGHQPFGLASPASWLRIAGAEVNTLDLSVELLDETLVKQADIIALYLPMHTATRLAIALIPKLRALNPEAHLCGYGLYASTNAGFLRELGVQTTIGGEFESALVDHCTRLDSGENIPLDQERTQITLDRLQFLTPDRTSLPALNRYARLILPDGGSRTAGYTQTTRGCKHSCRHCPIVPIYNGRFRIVQMDVVLSDVREMVRMGAEHITFGDPDFLNGPGHTIRIVEALHEEFPELSYDSTIKIEHLLKYDHLLPVLRDTGCAFITSAVESIDDDVLLLLDKGHSATGFEKAVSRLREIGITFNPTFVAFTPWTTPASYLDLLRTIRCLELVDSVSPIQYAIRLLIPAGSRLLDLQIVQKIIQPFSQKALSYPWDHPNPVMDDLYVQVFRLVQKNRMNQESRAILFNNVWQAALETARNSGEELSDVGSWDLASKPVPRMSESWY